MPPNDLAANAASAKRQKPGWSELIYVHLDRSIAVAGRAYAIIRRPFYNRLGWIAVFVGLFMASGSLWSDLVVSFIGEAVKERFPDFYAQLGAFWKHYELKIEPLTTICGTIIVALGLLYHWLAWKYDQGQRFRQYTAAMERLAVEQRHDESLLAAFRERFPHPEFEQCVAALAVNAGSSKIALLNDRYAFWRDPSNTFKHPELEPQKQRLCSEHSDLNSLVDARAEQSKVDAALDRLQKANEALVAGCHAAYRAQADAIAKEWSKR